MITKDTHSIDWNKTAQVTGVVLLTMAKGIWWLTKHTGLLLLAVLTVMAKVFVAILSVAGSTSSSPNDEDDEKPDSYLRHDGEGEIDLYDGVDFIHKID